MAKRSYDEIENINDVNGPMSSKHPWCSSDVVACEKRTEGHVL